MIKMKKKEKSFLEAIATLVGLIIGAGVLGIPYVVAQAGFFTGLVVIIVLGLVILLINLYVGEISLRTKGKHQLPGYIEKYLGKKGKFFMFMSLLITVYGGLTSYLIGEGEAWSAILGVEPIYPLLIFFVIMAFLVFKGLNIIKRIELGLNCLVLGIILLIALLSAHSINTSNFTPFDVGKLFIPYGVILFALVGSAAIPDLREELKHNRKSLKKAIILGSLIPSFIYLLFTVVVVGVTGINSTEIATVGLGEMVGSYMVFFGNLMAVFTMATSFLILALALLWVYHLDYKMKRVWAWSLTLFIPLIIALSNVASFIQVLAVTGAFAGGIEGILIVLAHRQSKKKGDRKPEYSVPNYLILSIILIIVFASGMLYTLYSLF